MGTEAARHVPSTGNEIMSKVLCSTLAIIAMVIAPGSYSADTTEHPRGEPMEVLKQHVERGLAVLTDPEFADLEEHDVGFNAQREQLCAVAQEMFDPYLFSVLSLGANWKRFSEDERDAFVSEFATYLCRYYLSRLQTWYSNETVEYIDQTYVNDARANVDVAVIWNNTRLPITIRMAWRHGEWRAFDAVVSGVSAVMIFRSQFASFLKKGAPADLIEDLRQRGAANG